jgi:broad specificity phosphatase PhoE
VTARETRIVSAGATSSLDGLLLARHGETDDNVPPIRFQGFRDTPLNDTGRVQAHELADRIAAEPNPVRSLWSSDLRRASETADIVGARIGLTPRLDPRLREANRGVWEGRLFIDVKREEPERFADFMRAGASFRFPGGESLQDQLDRVSAALEEIHASGELPALVVCHGGSIRVILCSRDPRGLDAFHEFEIPNVAVLKL